MQTLFHFHFTIHGFKLSSSSHLQMMNGNDVLTLIALLLILLDPLPKADEPLAWMYDKEKSELTFYTLKGERYRRYKMPDGEQFVGIYDDGKKVLFFGEEGKVAGKDNKNVSFHVRRLGNEERGTDLKIAFDRKTNPFWIFHDDLTVGLKSDYDDATDTYRYQLWQSNGGKMRDVNLPSKFSAQGWVNNRSELHGVMKSDAATKPYSRVGLIDGKLETLIPFDDVGVIVISCISTDGRYVIARPRVQSFINNSRPIYKYDLVKQTKELFIYTSIHGNIEGAFSPDNKFVFYSNNESKPPPNGKGGHGIDHFQYFINASDGKNPIRIQEGQNKHFLIGWIPSKKTFQFNDVKAKQ